MIGTDRGPARARGLVVALLALGLLIPNLAVARPAEPQPDAATHVSGQLALIWGDPQRGDPTRHATDAVILSDSGRILRIDLERSDAAALTQLAVLNGARVRAEGRLAGNGKLQLAALAPEGGPRPAATSGNGRPPVLGHQQWASILCRFGDMVDVTPQPREHIEALMNGPEPGIDHYFREVSDGSIDVAGSTVWGWYTLPQPRSYYITVTDSGTYIEYSRISEDCAGLADAQIDFNDYDGVNLMFNGELDGYARGGTYYYEFDGADRTFGTTWIPPWGYTTQYIMAHEMGHAFGLPHSSGPYEQTYDSMWDVMSLGGVCYPYHPQFGCVGPHTIAFHKDWLGWIPDERLFTFAAPQDATITLERSALPSDNGAYLLAKIPIQTTTTRFYTVEVRQLNGYDRYAPAQAVLIHLVDEGRFDRLAQVVDPDGDGDPNDEGAIWLPGETFRDALNDITITVDAATATGYVVTIHAGDAFTRTWARTDRPIVEAAASRTWMWGPGSFTGTIEETYLEGSGSVRSVRYYDKSRMEITDPYGDPASVWYVTNGLLVVELTTGRLQIGDNAFDQREPALVNVAGDADDAFGPTYATFGGLRNAPALPDGAPVVQRLDREGTVTDDPSLAARGVTAARRVQVPTIDHQVASPFWEFMNSSGVVWADGYDVAPLFQDPFYATGLPISEAYWSSVKVGGVYRDVLMQCFERRCLTYTPENPEGWKVEAGNVGLHYHAWRYQPVEFDGAIAFSSDRNGDSDIFILRGGTLDPVAVTTDPSNETLPDLSPDGTRVVFVRWEDEVANLWVADSDGSNAQRLTTGMHAFEPAWSPDGARIAFESMDDLGMGDIWVVDADGGAPVALTDSQSNERMPAWSPDGSRIVYSGASAAAGGFDLFVMDADGSDPTQLTFSNEDEIWPDWSPDGSTIAYTRASFGSEIMLIDAAGGQPRLLVASSGNAGEPSWSPDGSMVAYVDNTFGTSDIFIVDPDDGTPVNVSNSPAYETSPSWSVAAP